MYLDSLVVSSSEVKYKQADQFCEQFGYPYVPFDQLPKPDNTLLYVMNFSDERVELLSWIKKAAGPIYVDFVSGVMNHRRKHGGGRGELIAQAIGLKKGVQNLSVVDATAGLGRDAMVLANLGCKMKLYERNPVIYTLLEDGLTRARNSLDVELLETMGNIELTFGETNFELMVDVIYLDPMFPERQKSSQVKKEMRVFKDVVGDDLDSHEMLEKALTSTAKRVVVKRPRHSPCLGSSTPTFKVEGKSSRFDVYALKTLRAK